MLRSHGGRIVVRSAPARLIPLARRTNGAADMWRVAMRLADRCIRYLVQVNRECCLHCHATVGTVRLTYGLLGFHMIVDPFGTNSRNHEPCKESFYTWNSAVLLLCIFETIYSCDPAPCASQVWIWAAASAQARQGSTRGRAARGRAAIAVASSLRPCHRGSCCHGTGCEHELK